MLCPETMPPFRALIQWGWKSSNVKQHAEPHPAPCLLLAGCALSTECWVGPCAQLGCPAWLITKLNMLLNFFWGATENSQFSTGVGASAGVVVGGDGLCVMGAAFGVVARPLSLLLGSVPVQPWCRVAPGPHALFLCHRRCLIAIT